MSSVLDKAIHIWSKEKMSQVSEMHVKEVSTRTVLQVLSEILQTAV